LDRSFKISITYSFKISITYSLNDYNVIERLMNKRYMAFDSLNDRIGCRNLKRTRAHFFSNQS